MKRILSLILVLTMLCSLCTVFAQEEAPAEETAAEGITETAPEETAAEETAAQPAEAAAEETPAEEPAEETPAEEPAEKAAEEPAEEAPAEEPDAEPAADGEAATEGTCGDGVTWSLDTGTGVLTISSDGTGTGAMTDYAIGTAPWYANAASVRRAEIADGVTSIGSYAFYACIVLKSVTIADSVETIGNEAFYGCSTMERVQIGSGVTSIGSDAFDGCNFLQQITYSGSITGWVLLNCQLPSTEITITCNDGTYDASVVGGRCGEDLIWILDGNACTLKITGTGAMTDYEKAGYVPWYNDRTSLKSVEIADGVTSIGSYAFFFCRNLTSVTIPGSVTSIGSYAFRTCNSLAEVTIPAGVTAIGVYAFSDCPALTAVYYGGDEADRAAITIGGNNTDLTDGPTWHYTYTVRYDAAGGEGAPEAQTKQAGETLTLSNASPTRDGSAFAGWAESSTAAEAAYQPGGSYTGDRSTTLYAVWVPMSGTCGEDLTWAFDASSGTLSISGTGAMTDYDKESDAPWDFFRGDIRTAVIGDGVKTIGNRAFMSCSRLTAVELPDSLQSIGAYAFCSCRLLEGITIPDSVQSIGTYAFSHCNEITDAVLPAGLTTVPDFAFTYCINLKTVTLPKDVTSIGVYAFGGCSALTDVYYHADGSYDAKQNITFGVKNTELQNAAWHYTYTITYDANGGTGAPDPQDGDSTGTLYLSETVPVRDGYTFLGWSNTTDSGYNWVPGGEFTYSGPDVTLYAVWEGIVVDGSCGDQGNNVAWSLNEGTGVLTISGEGSMADYTAQNSPFYKYRQYIKTVSIESGVTAIGEYAFADCTALATINIPRGLTTIGRYAFENTGLKDVYYSGTLADRNGLGGIAAMKIVGGSDSLDNAAWHYTCTLTFNDNGGTGGPGTQIWISGVTEKIDETVPTRTGYIFLGWAEDPSAEKPKYQPGGSYPYQFSWTLYALWEAIIVDGTCGADGDNLTWTLNEGTGVLTISGTGEMDAYDGTGASSAPWYEYADFIRSVKVEDGVTTIGSSAFGFCTKLQSVSLPDSLTSIGEKAFYYCVSLKSVTIPAGVQSTGSLAFARCEAMTELTFAAGRESAINIGSQTFSGCVGLESVVLPEKTATVGSWVFNGCTGLKTVTIPVSVTEICMYAFNGCTGLTDVNYSGTDIEMAKVEIGEHNDCLTGAVWHYTCTVTYDANGGTNLPDPQTKNSGEDLTLSSQKAYREGYAFMGWTTDKTSNVIEYIAGGTYTADKSVTLYAVWAAAGGSCGQDMYWTIDTKGVLTISYTGTDDNGAIAAYPAGDAPWYAYREGIRAIIVGEGVAEVTSNAFINMSAAESVSLPGTLTGIGYCAFSGCSSLKSVSLPPNVTAIETAAFEKCTSLTTLRISADVTGIDEDAFAGCTSLKDIYFCGTEDTWKAFAVTEPEGCTVHYEAHLWDEGKVTKQADYMTAGSKTRTCTVCGQTVSEEIPALTSVGGTCGDGVNWVLDADGVLTVSGSGTMYSYVNDDAPWGNYTEYIKTAVIKDGVTSIGDGAFSECRQLTAVTIPDSVTAIGIAAFIECVQLTAVTIPDSVTSIGAGAFYRCSSLTSIVIPSGVQVIPLSTFYSCTSLERVELPVSVTQIVDGAFADCGSLADVYYAGSSADRAAVVIDEGNDDLTDADWHYALYAVSYNANGGENAPAARNVVPGESVTIGGIDPREGYVFLGWAADKDAVKADYAAGETCTPESDLTLYAVWAELHALTCSRSYTANIEKAGGSVWYEFTPASGKTYVLYTTGSAKVTITLYDAEGEALATGTDRLSYPMAANTTYRFAVRYTDETAAGTVSLKFGRVYTVKFNANGGTGAPKAQLRDYGSTLRLTEDTPVREGYTFLGWSADKTAETAAYAAGADYNVNGNVTLYAVWEDAALALASGRGYTAQIAEAGSAAYYKYTPAGSRTYVLYTDGSEDVTITLYDAAGSVLAEGTNRLAYPMTADETYRYAVRYADDTAESTISLKFGRVYTVKFSANGGTGAPAAQTKDYGTAMQLPGTIPVREGFFFLGWAGSASAGAAAYEAGGNYTANGNTTLYAVWAGLLPLASGRSYTADIKAYSTGVYYSFTPANSNTYVLYANGGENVTITLYDEAGDELGRSGEDASVSAKLTAGETYVYRVSPNDGYAGSVSLKFGRVYTIRYNANGGTGAPAAQTRNYGSDLILTDETPVREGYTFLGWSASSTAGKAAYSAGDAYTANGNVTLYAVWQENP